VPESGQQRADDEKTATGRVADGAVLVLGLSADGRGGEDGAWEPLVALVLDSVTSPHSRRAYEAALKEFLAWWKAAGKPRS
jgi:hypothetical protein